MTYCQLATATSSKSAESTAGSAEPAQTHWCMPCTEHPRQQPSHRGSPELSWLLAQHRANHAETQLGTTSLCPPGAGLRLLQLSTWLGHPKPRRCCLKAGAHWSFPQASGHPLEERSTVASAHQSSSPRALSQLLQHPLPVLRCLFESQPAKS